jgi:hypothetical protein
MFIKFTIAMMITALWLFVSIHNPETNVSETVLQSVPLLSHINAAQP